MRAAPAEMELLHCIAPDVTIVDFMDGTVHRYSVLTAPLKTCSTAHTKYGADCRTRCPSPKPCC
jgi:hypothetical protein